MTDKSFSFLSLNIEGQKHLERVRNFILERRPDVICLQEIQEPDFEQFKKYFGMAGVYAPMTRFSSNHKLYPNIISGLAILSKNPIVLSNVYHYSGAGEGLPIWSKEKIAETNAYIILSAEIDFGKKKYTIAVTHFVWTPDGEADENQRRALPKMFEVLEKNQSFVLCGDFNAPRGREIFSAIAAKYKDNIPPEYDSSLDPDLHRAKGLKLMVDGLFSTPDYKVEDVKLVCGISDHCAITAKILKQK